MIRRRMVNPPLDAACAPRPVILTQVRIQSQAVPPSVTLGPDIRQDDGRL